MINVVSIKNKLPETLSWSTYLEEQKVLLSYLSKLETVDAKKIFVMGHSEGALHVLKLDQNLDQDSIKPAGLILLAPPGQTMSKLIRVQLSKQYKKLPLSSIFYTNELIKTRLDKLQEGFDSVISKQPHSSKDLGLGLIERRLYEQFSHPKLLPFTSEILNFDPSIEIKKISRNLLIVGGEKDYQVDPDDVKFLFENAVSTGKKNFTLKMLPFSDHVFKVEETPFDKLSPRRIDYNSYHRFLDYELVSVISDWIYCLKNLQEK